MLKRLPSRILRKLVSADPTPRSAPPPRPVERQPERSAYEAPHPLSFAAHKRNRGRSGVPPMTTAEIEADYAERGAEQQRRAAEQRVELERARAEAQQPQPPPAPLIWDPPEVGDLRDYDF